MQFLILTVLALLTTTPALAVGSLPDKEWNEEEQVGREDQRNTRQFLYDEIAADAIIDGHASEAVHACLNFEMRFRRSDGAIVVRRLDSCE